MIRKLISVICAIVMTLSLFACNEMKAVNVQAEIWTMPSTEKILKNLDYSKYYTDKPSLEFELAKNEYECMQLLINPKIDIASYDLLIDDLKDSKGNIIPKGNIQLYNQGYVNVTSRTLATSNRPLGYYPDALVLFDLAKQAKENKIVKGENQGIYIALKTDKTTIAGNYTSTFTLTIDKKSISIPVIVNVWDFEVTDASHLRNNFNMFQEYTMGGALSNTKETYKKYVDYLLGYRISTNDIVSNDYNDEDWLALIKQYAADNRVTSYNVYTNERLGLLIRNSTPELNLLDKALFYLYDEPYTYMDMAKNGYYKKIDELIAIANTYTEEQLSVYGLKKSDIEGVEALITLTASINTIEGLRTYCPLASDLDSQANRDMYKDFAKNAYTGKNNELAGTNYGTTWWYVCNHPYEPYPNYGIDMDLSASRVMSWMQYAYKIEGLLYWGTATYASNDTMIDNLNGWVTADVYNRSNGTYAAANGEGYLVYPGTKYGVDEPMPSIRLMSIRDGFEDYEYLYMLEELVTKYAAEYKVSNFSFDSIMSNIYSSVFTGAIPSKDFNSVVNARKKVAQMIELLSKEAKAIYSVGDLNPISNSVDITLYAKQGSYLKVGDKTIAGVDSGNGTKIVYTLDLSQDKNYFIADLCFNDTTININDFIINKIKSVSNFESDSDVSLLGKSKSLDKKVDHIDLKLNTDKNYVVFGQNSLKANVKALDWSISEQANYRPSISISKEMLLGNSKFSEIGSINFSIYNNSNFEFDFSLELEASMNGETSKYKKLKATKLSKGWNIIKIPDISKTTWELNGKSVFDYITKLNIFFELGNKDIEVYIDNIYYELP